MLQWGCVQKKNRKGWQQFAADAAAAHKPRYFSGVLNAAWQLYRTEPRSTFIQDSCALPLSCSPHLNFLWIQIR